MNVIRLFPLLPGHKDQRRVNTWWVGDYFIDHQFVMMAVIIDHRCSLTFICNHCHIDDVCSCSTYHWSSRQWFWHWRLLSTILRSLLNRHLALGLTTLDLGELFASNCDLCFDHHCTHLMIVFFKSEFQSLPIVSQNNSLDLTFFYWLWLWPIAHISHYRHFRQYCIFAGLNMTTPRSGFQHMSRQAGEEAAEELISTFFDTCR